MSDSAIILENKSHSTKTVTTGCRSNEKVIFAQETVIEPSSSVRYDRVPLGDFQVAVSIDNNTTSGQNYVNSGDLGKIVIEIHDSGIQFVDKPNRSSDEFESSSPPSNSQTNQTYQYNSTGNRQSEEYTNNPTTPASNDNQYQNQQSITRKNNDNISNSNNGSHPHHGNRNQTSHKNQLQPQRRQQSIQNSTQGNYNQNRQFQQRSDGQDATTKGNQNGLQLKNTDSLVLPILAGIIVTKICLFIPVIHFVAGIIGGFVSSYMSGAGPIRGVKVGFLKGFIFFLPALILASMLGSFLAEIPAVGDLLAGSILFVALVLTVFITIKSVIGGFIAGLLADAARGN